MPTDDELSLIVRAQQGDREAQHELIQRNEGVIHAICDRWMSLAHFDKDDMLQEGRIGILVAIMRFDVNVNVKFTTFSTYIVKRHLVDYARNHGRTIRLPQNAFTIYRDKMAVEHEWLQQHRRFTLDDIAKEIGAEPESVHLICTMLDTPDAVVSIDNIVDATSMESKYEIDFLSEIERAIEHGEFRRIILNLLKKLPPRERDVIRRRYGFNRKPQSLTSIARQWDVTPSRVSQLHNKALRRLAQMIGDQLESHVHTDSYGE